MSIGHRQQRRDSDVADAAGRSGRGVQPVIDPRDRGGEGQDRQGRRADPGAAARGGLSSAGLAARRPHPQFAPAGRAAGLPGPVMDPDQGSGPCDPEPQGESLPRVLPNPDQRRMPQTTMLSQVVERQLPGRGAFAAVQIGLTSGSRLIPMLPGRQPERVAGQTDDAGLHGGQRPRSEYLRGRRRRLLPFRVCWMGRPDDVKATAMLHRLHR